VHGTVGRDAFALGKLVEGGEGAGGRDDAGEGLPQGGFRALGERLAPRQGELFPARGISDDQAAQSRFEGLRLGVPREYFVEGMDPEVEAAVREAIEVLKRLGGRAEPISLPATDYALAAYYLIAPAEALINSVSIPIA